MSETLSLNAMIENPTVFVLAQRPGPATGLPTWTAQGGLLQAVHACHGEFTRCVLSVSNSQDAFDLMPVAFNLAEQYQITVIVLTDKQIAEALYTQEPYDLEKAEIHRGKLVTDPGKLKALKPADGMTPAPRTASHRGGFPAARPRPIAPRAMNTIPPAPWMSPGPITSRRRRRGCGSSAR